jgi:leucyl aminopeptidase (aminopeptidase T)
MSAVNYDLLSAARRVVDGALGAVPGERLVVVTDGERSEVRDAFREAADWAKLKIELFLLDDFGPAPLRALPRAIAAALENAQLSVYAGRAGAEEIGLRRELVEAVARYGLRHAHMVGVTAPLMAAGLAVDPHRIAEVSRALRARLRPDSLIHASSPRGTELEVRCDGRFRWIDNSGLIRPGRWQNLPAGELLTAPGSVKGRYVCDAAVTSVSGLETTTTLRATPVRLQIDGRRVVSVECESAAIARGVQGFLRGGSNYDRVGLVSFGTNIGLFEPTGSLIVDQTMPGLHIVLGMTHSALTGADWDAAGQLVLAGEQANIDIDGEVVMRAGRYLLH